MLTLIWRLRSYCEWRKETYIGGVNWDGEVSPQETDKETKGVSPALNVSLSSVLLASVSELNAKSSDLAAVTNSTAIEWKLTLLDNNKTVSVTQGQNIERQGTTITVPYTYGGSDVSQISIMITDKAYRESNAQVLYYGKLQDVTTGSTTGTGTFTLPAGLASQTCGTDYYAYIIAEDINAVTTTDYASAPAQITIPAAPASITRVDITGIDVPVAGRPLDTEADCQSEGVKNTLTVSWGRNHTTAKYGTSYTASVKLEAKDGYEFANVNDIAATVNGEKAVAEVLDGGTYRVRYTFPETAKAKLNRITAPADITGIANGTPKEAEALGLPAAVTIETDDESITTATVNWDLNNCNYDPAKTEKQTVTISGTVTCPEKVDANGVELTTSITITVNAANVADTVAAPTASVSEGTYRENQTVILTSATEGADIYYTMGADLYSGKRYTEGILVKAEPGRTETTTIKAMATKDGVWSNMATFTYTIDLTGGTSEEQAPAITSHPQNKAVKTGEQAVFTVEATGTNLTYQWQINRNNGKGFANIDGANSASYTTDVADMSYNGFRYQCVVSNSASSVTSGIATLTVTDELTPPSGITYTITATAGEHGSITPSGNVAVKDGESQSFDITADEGYEIEALLVDDKETTIAPRYTFDKVTSKHSITVTFKQKGSTSDPEQPEKPNPAEKPKQEAEPAGNQAPQHEHNFRWVTVQTASAAQDGLEELRCDCGMVMESSVVPASRAYVNELCQNLAAAMENGSVTFDSGRIYTISDYIIKRLRDRADVTTTITFEYNHSQYRMIIPAGVDYTELLEDQDYFYGYFYFAKKVGAKVENL